MTYPVKDGLLDMDDCGLDDIPGEEMCDVLLHSDGDMFFDDGCQLLYNGRSVENLSGVFHGGLAGCHPDFVF